jgi:hypothetical protein
VPIPRAVWPVPEPTLRMRDVRRAAFELHYLIAEDGLSKGGADGIFAE